MSGADRLEGLWFGSGKTSSTSLHLQVSSDSSAPKALNIFCGKGLETYSSKKIMYMSIYVF